MNMQQPDPSGLFDQYQNQSRTPPANPSVTAQIGQRPTISQDLPAVSISPSPATPSPTPALPEAPVNPFVALYESGEMEKAVQQAEQKALEQNPFKQLFDSGEMTHSVLTWEDRQYEQALKNWEKRKREFIPYPGMGINAYPEAPQAPIRKPEQIAKDWDKGVYHLRGAELGSILSQLETGKLTPEQEAGITQHIEPQLTPEIRTQLQIARLTRDELQKLNESALAEEQMAEEFGKDILYMNPFQIARDERFGKNSRSGKVFGRNVAKGLTMNYAFAPDEERLNSDDPAIVADERAKQLFYLQQDLEYPVTAFPAM